MRQCENPPSISRHFVAPHSMWQSEYEQHTKLHLTKDLCRDHLRSQDAKTLADRVRHLFRECVIYCSVQTYADWYGMDTKESRHDKMIRKIQWLSEEISFQVKEHITNVCISTLRNTPMLMKEIFSKDAKLQKIVDQWKEQVETFWEPIQGKLPNWTEEVSYMIPMPHKVWLPCGEFGTYQMQSRTIDTKRNTIEKAKQELLKLVDIQPSSEP